MITPALARARRLVAPRLGVAAVALTWLACAGVAAAEPSVAGFLQKTWDRAVQAAEAQSSFEVSDDADTPIHNAVVRVGGCSGALITPTVVLTAGHCTPRELVKREEAHPDCSLLSAQARLAGYPWEDAMVWRDFPRGGVRVDITARRDNAKMTIGTVAASQPRCADMALLRLARPVPDSVARPLPVMTSKPFNVDRTFGGGQLRFAGWGIAKSLVEAHPFRQTGPVRYWGANPCFIAALPPLRRSGHRIISGDSGAPLLIRQGEGEVVAGVLWGKGLADAGTCGLIHPLPPQRYGLYTPTFRPAILGTGATDIGLWLRTMVPEADHR